jgi:hypothetical protein
MKAAVTGHAQPADGMAFSRHKWVATGLWFLGLGLAAALASESADGNDWWLHGAWCLGGMLIASVTLWRAMRRDFSVLITDHLVMFTAAFSVYFLFGASFMTFGEEDEVLGAMRFYDMDAISALRVNAINAIGFGIALMVAAISPRDWFFQTTVRAARHSARIPGQVALGLLLALGASAYGYTLLYDFGFREGVIPGIIRTTANLTLVGIFLAVSYPGRHKLLFRSFAVVLAVSQALIGVLLFNKTQIVMPLAAFVVGLALFYRPKVVMPLGITLIVAVYIGSSGMVAHGRITLDTRSPAPFSERLDVAIRGLQASREDNPLARASSWGRLSYITSQGAAMELYDRGMRGNDFNLLPWLFVPRLLAPDKPEITQTPRELYHVITGGEGTSIGVGVFSSGYYSGGWLGVIAASCLAGWILAQTSAIAAAVIAARGTLLLPFALLGVFTAFRIDGAFLADYAGSFVYLLCFVVASWLLYSRRRIVHRV